MVSGQENIMKFQQNFKVLSEEEMLLIHMRVLETLEEMGIMVEEKQSLELLEKHGARVDYDLKRAYLPATLVKWALDVKKDSFTLYSAKGDRAVFMGGDIVHYAPLGYSVTYLDKEGNVHDGTYDALNLEAKYVNVMEEYDLMHPSIQPCDKPAALQDMYMLKAMLLGTDKPIHCVANSEAGATGMLRMHAEVVGGKEELKKHPRHMFNLCTFSPLGIRRDVCEVIRAATEYDAPCMFSTGTMAGATAPVTLAGSMVESLSEVLGHIVLQQCYKPGQPSAMLHASRIFDMKYAACTVATPEYAIMKVAACQMANYYKIPIGTIGLCADSNDYDYQLGWEKFMTSFIPAQAGMNMNFGGGMYSQLNQFSFPVLAMDTEMIRVEKRLARGMEVNEDTIMFDVLKEESVRGNFLYHKTTLEGWKNEFMTPVLSDRAPYTQFMKRNGKKTFVDRAIKELEKAEKKFCDTVATPMEDKLQAIIDEYAYLVEE